MTNDELAYEVAELKRVISNMIRPGVVVSVNNATNPPTAVLDLGIDNNTHQIPNGANHSHAGGAEGFSIKPGMQVTVFSPDGDLQNAFFTPGGSYQSTPQFTTRDDEAGFLRQGGSEFRLREGGYAKIAAGSIDKLKFLIGSTWYQLDPSALVATSPLES